MSAHDTVVEQVGYTNRFGETYHLHAQNSPAGARYVMRKEPDGALQSLPAGYEIREGMNGRLSVGRIRSGCVAVLELALVRSALAQIRPHGYRVDAQDSSITIFASAQDGRCFAESIDAEFAEGFAAALEETLARKYGRELAELFRAKRQRQEKKRRSLRFYPLLRFQLANKTSRTFLVQRIYFSGDQDWLTLETLPLSAAVMKYVPHLGRDSFFDLL